MSDKAIMSLAMVLVFGGFIITFKLMMPDIKNTGKDNNRECKSQSGAKYALHQVMQSKLKSPSTADFASILNINHKYMGSCKHYIKSYVDSQNGFGATVRTSFKGFATYNKTTENWRVTEFSYK